MHQYLRTSDKCAGWSVGPSPDFKSLKGKLRRVESSNQLSTLGFVRNNCIHLFPCVGPLISSCLLYVWQPGPIRTACFLAPAGKANLSDRKDGRPLNVRWNAELMTSSSTCDPKIHRKLKPKWL